MHLAIEIIHYERTENRDVVLVGELVKLIFKVHARSDVSSLPKKIHHLAPPTNFWVAAPSTRPCNDIVSPTQEYWRVRHAVAHKLREKLIRIDDAKLSARLRCFHIHAFGH